MSKEAESIGIAFEMSDIIPEITIEQRLESSAFSLRKECLECLLSRMSERGIAHIMR